jgi:hypothetical protein
VKWAVKLYTDDEPALLMARPGSSRACTSLPWRFVASVLFLVFFTVLPTGSDITSGSAASGEKPASGDANIASFGAISSSSTLACTATEGSPTLACANTGDYQNGQTVLVPAGGRLPAGELADGPGDLTVVSTLSGGGGAQLSNISRTYEVTKVDPALGESAPTHRVSVVDGPIMLGGNAWEDVEWDCDIRAAGYRVYGCQGAACTPRFLGWVKQPTVVQVCGYDDVGFSNATEMVAVGPNPASVGPFGRTLLGHPLVPKSVYVFQMTPSTNPTLLGNDDGSGKLTGTGISSGTVEYSSGRVSITLGSPIDNRTELWLAFTPANGASAAPRHPTRDFLHSSIVSGAGGPRLTLSTNLGLSGSVRVAHDDAPALQGALNSLVDADPRGGIVVAPRGTYSIGSLISIPDQVSLEGHGGGTEYGPGSTSPNVDVGTTFVWNGPDNMSIFDVRNGTRQALRRFTIDAQRVNAGSSVSTGLTGVHVDADSNLSSGADKTNLEDLTIVQAHHGIEFGGNLQTRHVGPHADVSESRIKQVHFLHTIDKTDITSKGFVLDSGNIFLMRFTHNTCLCLNRCLDDVNSGAIMVDTMAGGGCADMGSNPTTIYDDSGAGGLFENMEDEPGNISNPFYSVWLPRTAPGTGNSNATTLLNNTFGGHILIADISSVVSDGNTTAKRIIGQTWQLDGNMAGGFVLPNLSGGADGGPGWSVGPLGGVIGDYYNSGTNLNGKTSVSQIFNQLNRLVIQSADGTRLPPMITLCAGPGVAAGAASDCWSLSYGLNGDPTYGEFGYGGGTSPSGYPAGNDLIRWTRNWIEFKSLKNDCSGSHVLSRTPPDTIRNACITGKQPVLCSVQNAPHTFSCNPGPGSLQINGTAGDTLYWWQG